MLAARSGNTSEVKRLVSSGAELDEQSRYGWTALMFAAWKGHTRSVRILLEAGADPNVVSDSVPSRFETVAGHPPTSALQEAVRNGRLTIAKILIEGGATIDPGSVALAGRTGGVEFMSYLVQEGADLNTSSRNAFHATPLCTAAASGHLKTVQWLIENGADPNQVAASQTALKEAVDNDEQNIVRYLLENGANPNIVYGRYEKTALITAVTKHTGGRNYAGNLSIIELLLKHGADTRHKAFGGSRTALEFSENYRAGTLGYLDEATSEETKEIYQASLSHQDAVTALLKNK